MVKAFDVILNNFEFLEDDIFCHCRGGVSGMPPNLFALDDPQNGLFTVTVASKGGSFVFCVVQRGHKGRKGGKRIGNDSNKAATSSVSSSVQKHCASLF